MSLTTSARPASNAPRKPVDAAKLTSCPIGQAAEKSGVSAKMIRYYESIGLVRPAARSAANYRSYDAAAVQTLHFIARARSLGFSLHEITRLLGLWREPERNSADVKAVALAHVADLNRRIAALKAMKNAIEKLARHCPGDEHPDCPIISDLAGDTPQNTRPRRRSHG